MDNPKSWFLDCSLFSKLWTTEKSEFAKRLLQIKKIKLKNKKDSIFFIYYPYRQNFNKNDVNLKNFLKILQNYCFFAEESVM